MTLYDKIVSIYPQLTINDFQSMNLSAHIAIQNDSDGNGDYIKVWTHPTLTRPTQEQLDAVE
jgi:hypothetical protein